MNDGIAAISTRQRRPGGGGDGGVGAASESISGSPDGSGRTAAAASARTARGARPAPDDATTRAHAVVGRHQQQDDRGLAARCAGVARPKQRRDQRHQQIDVDDRHPVDREPVPVERAERTRAVRRRQIHQHVQSDADHRHRDEHRERRIRSPRASLAAVAPIEQPAADPDESRRVTRPSPTMPSGRASGRDATRDTSARRRRWRRCRCRVRSTRAAAPPSCRVRRGRAACARASAPNSVWVRLSKSAA